MQKQPDISLEEKRALEIRTCPLCRYTIENPFLYRCPRCNTALPFEDPGCNHCIHSAGCPVSAVKKR